MTEQSCPTESSGLDCTTRKQPSTYNSQQRLSLLQYYEEGDIDNLREHIQQSLENKTFNTHELIELAKGSKEAAALVKELIHVYKIDETELADRIAKEILCDIEAYTDLHLQKYDNKFTLNAPQLTSKVDGSKAKFFNLISLLRDVSILGRKLLETSPRYDSSKPRPAGGQVASAILTQQVDNPMQDKQQRLHQQQSRDTRSQMSSEEDATSDDLLAALIESSSTDDFLVLSSSLESITLRDMMVAALVIITSHECFTLSHDIQGVVMVLRRAKFLIKNILAPKNQMELVARLLTAISRYNEMNYVFDLFRDRNQFEILLSKGVEKTPGLRIALYNYVKKNPEFYALVTLNFSMFREIAESLEASAAKRLEKLVQQGKAKKAKARKKVSLILGSGSETTAAAPSHQISQPPPQHFEASVREPQATNTSQAMFKSNSFATSLSGLGGGGGGGGGGNTDADQKPAAGETKVASGGSSSKPLYSRDALQLCLVELVDASDCFARAGCYKRSNDCANKAKLVALQLALLPSNGEPVNVLDLKQAELSDLIVSLECFSDAYIVAQAYDYHLTWRQALFRNVVLRGQTDYLEEFCCECDLSESLIMELVVLYRQHLASNQFGHEELARLGEAMKSILKHLKRVALKCQLYNEFQFNDAKEELLKNDSVRAYLKDLKLVST